MVCSTRQGLGGLLGCPNSKLYLIEQAEGCVGAPCEGIVAMYGIHRVGLLHFAGVIVQRSFCDKRLRGNVKGWSIVRVIDVYVCGS